MAGYSTGSGFIVGGAAGSGDNRSDLGATPSHGSVSRWSTSIQPSPYCIPVPSPRFLKLEADSFSPTPPFFFSITPILLFLVARHPSIFSSSFSA